MRAFCFRAVSGLGLGVVFLIANSANATPILINGFSGSESVITFTGLSGSQGTSFTNTGVTFTNTQGFSFQVSSGFNSFFANVPGSSGDPVLFDSKGATFNTDFRMTFSTPVNRVGLLFASSYSEPYTLEAYDAANTLLESVATTTVGSQASFLGLQETTPIAYLRLLEPGINDSVTIADDLRFEAVPLPNSVCIFVMGGLSLLGMIKRGRRWFTVWAYTAAAG